MRKNMSDIMLTMLANDRNEGTSTQLARELLLLRNAARRVLKIENEVVIVTEDDDLWLGCLEQLAECSNEPHADIVLGDVDLGPEYLNPKNHVLNIKCKDINCCPDHAPAHAHLKPSTYTNEECIKMEEDALCRIADLPKIEKK